jgi:hypothetical protein
VNHSDEIVSGFGKLLKSESMTDVTLSCQGGLNIRAHRIVLSTFSPYFRAIFESQPFVDTPWTYPVVVMKDYGFLEVKAIIEFVYRGEVSVPRPMLASVLATARALEVSGLADLKAENFGVASAASGSGESGSGNSSPPVNGSGFSGSSLSAAGSLTPAAATPASGTKRAVSSSISDLHPNSESVFGHHSDTIASVLMAKKLRGCLDSNEINSSAAALSSLATATADSSAAALHPSLTSLTQLDGVRSLLQQPPRLPSSVLNQLVQQQLRQQQHQQQLQQLALHQNQRPAASASAQAAPQPVVHRNVSLQHMMQHKVAPAHMNQNSGSTGRLHARHMQLQSHNLKQQILQQQLMRSKNLQATGAFARNTQAGSHPFAQFQQRIRQQIQEKQRNQHLQNRHLMSKSFGAVKDRSVKLESSAEERSHNQQQHHDDDDEEEVSVIIKENDSGDKENGNAAGHELDMDEENGNEDSSDRQVKQEERSSESLDHEENQLVVREDEEHQNQNEEDEDMDHEDEEYEIEIDKDAIFQQQQQLRLQQIQKQQHQYQMQLEQAEQEQRLLDYQQTLSQAAADSEDNDNDDTGSGYGFDWQEGFTDDLPYGGQKMGDTASLIKSHHLQSANINSNTNGNRNTPIQTPDFLQPRGREYFPSHLKNQNQSIYMTIC